MSVHHSYIFLGFLELIFVEGVPPTIDFSWATNRHVYNINTSETVTLDCPVYGTPTPKVMWRRDGELLPNENHRWLVMSPVNNIDGVYQCEGVNDMGSIKGDFINVYENKSQNSSQKWYRHGYHVGDTISLVCSQDEIEPRLPTTWKKSHLTMNITNDLKNTYTKAFRNGIKTDMNPENSDSGRIVVYGSTLILTSALMSDEGIYECKMRDAHVSKTKSWHYLKPMTKEEQIEQSPTLVKFLSDKYIHVRIGENLSIACIVKGNPAPTIEWFKDGVNITENGYYLKRNRRLLEVQQTRTVDSGTYVCQAYNKIGRENFNFFVYVESPPMYEESTLSTNVSAIAGQDVQFHCVSHTSPKPSVRWFLNTSSIENSRWNVSADGEYINLHNFTESDIGSVVCNVSNRHGYFLHSMYLSSSPPNVLGWRLLIVQDSQPTSGSKAAWDMPSVITILGLYACWS